MGVIGAGISQDFVFMHRAYIHFWMGSTTVEIESDFDTHHGQLTGVWHIAC